MSKNIPIPERYKLIQVMNGVPVIMPEFRETLRLIGEDGDFSKKFLATLEQYEEASNNDLPKHDIYKAVIHTHLVRIGYEFEDVPLYDLTRVLEALERYLEGACDYVE